MTRKRQRGEGMETRPCEYCEKPVTRWPSEFMEHTTCSPRCEKLRRQVEAAKRLLEKPQRLAQLDLQSAARVCRGYPKGECPAGGEPQPLKAFPRDRSRPDGHSALCGVCNGRRCKAAYIERREARGG